tara:strand:+ start:30117 stop:30686 length:570 start_codon:yes stop_codon:yes gene_type:complete
MKLLSLLLVFLCLLDLKSIRFFEIVWDPKKDIPEEKLAVSAVRDLTDEEGKEFKIQENILSGVRDSLGIVDPDNGKNVAYYSLSVQIDGETHEIKLGNRALLFLSGGDLDLSQALANQTGGCGVNCIANYFPPEKANDSTYLLRRAIAESFRFKEAQPGFSTRMSREFEKQVAKSMRGFKEAVLLKSEN